MLKPRADEADAIIARDGGISDEAAAKTSEVFLLTRIDQAVLFMVIADMALKPTAADVWTLVAMAAIIVVAVVLVARAMRAPVSPAAAQKA